MAFPTIVNIGASSGASGNITLTLPASITTGDLLIILAETQDEALSAPSGYSVGPSIPVTNTGNTRLYIFYKIATASESDPLLTSPGNHVVGGMIAIRGQATDGSTPFGAVNTGTGSGTGITFPSITTQQNDALVLLAVATARDGNSTAHFTAPTNANLTSITERHDRTVNAGGGGGFQLSTGLRAAAGNIGTSAGTQLTADAWAAITLEVRPFRHLLTASPGSFSHTGIPAEVSTTAQLPPVVVGVGALNAGVGNGYVDTLFPTNIQERDLLVVFMETADQIGYVRTDISPGWTQVTGSPFSNVGNTRLTAYWTIANENHVAAAIAQFPSGVAVQVNNGAPDHIVSGVVAIRGWNTALNAWQGGNQSSSGSGISITLGGPTTTGDNELILAVVASAVDSTGGVFSSWANAGLGGLTEIADGSTTTGNGGGLGIASGLKATAGSVGNSTVDQTTAVPWVGAVLSIKPPPRNHQHLNKGVFTISGSAKLTTSVRLSRPWPVGNYLNFEDKYSVECSTEDSTYDLPIVIPPWAQEGDLLVAFICWNSSSTNPILTGDGWTQLSGSPLESHFNEDMEGSIWYKRCGVNEPAPTFAAHSLSRYGHIIVIRDAITRGQPFHIATKSGNGQGSLTNAVVGTTTINDALLLVGHLVSRASYVQGGNSNGNIDSGGFPASLVNPTNPPGTLPFTMCGWITMYDGKTTAGNGGNIQNSISEFLDVYSFVGALVGNQTHVLDAHIGQFSVKGKESTLQFGVPGEEMIADQANYTHSGAAAFFTIARKLIAEAVLLSHTGNVATMITSRRMLEDDGVYSVNGVAATLKINRVLNAEAGVFTHTGQTADFFFLDQGNYAMAGGIGTFDNTGQTSTLRVSRIPLTAEQGVFTETGIAASLRRQLAALTANGGLFSLDGIVALLYKSTNMDADLGIFSVVGLPANLTNVFSAGQFTIAGQSATISRTYKLVADAGIFELLAETPLLFATSKPSWQIRSIVDLYPVITSYTDHEHGGRLTVGATEIPIKSWTYEEPDNEITGSLQIVLAFNNHRTLLTKDANLKFESVQYLGGTPVWTTLFELGRIQSHIYTQITEDELPANVVQFVGVPPMKAKLDIAPLDNEVYYNPDAHEVNPEDFELIPDEAGTNIVTNLHPISQMGLHALFNDIFVGICGFDAVETSLPDIKVNRLDLMAGQSAADAVLSLVPMYKPDASTVGNTIWVRDGTALYSNGMPAPRQLTNTYLSNSTISTQYNRLRGIIVQYAQKGLDFDSYTIDIQSSGNVWGIGQFHASVEYERYIVKFYKSTRPNVIVKEVLLREKRWYYGNGGVLFKMVTDNYAVDFWGRTLSRQSILESPYFNTSGQSAFTWTLTENERYTYFTYPFRPDSYYTRFHNIWSQGMVYIDSVNTQGDQPFVRSVMDTIRSGNWVPQLTNDWRSIKNYRESQFPISKDRTWVQTTETDYLSGHVNNEIQIDKIGDISASVYSMQPKKLFIPSETVDAQFQSQ